MKTTNNMVPPSFSEILDRSEVVDWKATVIFAEAAKCYDQNLNEFNTDRLFFKAQTTIKKENCWIL